MTALRGRTFPPPLVLLLFAVLAEALWLLGEVLLVLGCPLGLLLPEGLLLGAEPLGLLPEGVAVPDGRLLPGVLLAGFPLGFAVLVGLVLVDGPPLPEGCAVTGLFSAKTGSFTAGFS